MNASDRRRLWLPLLALTIFAGCARLAAEASSGTGSDGGAGGVAGCKQWCPPHFELGQLLA
jgi:hypothetical protein